MMIQPPATEKLRVKSLLTFSRFMGAIVVLILILQVYFYHRLDNHQHPCNTNDRRYPALESSSLTHTSSSSHETPTMEQHFDRLRAQAADILSSANYSRSCQPPHHNDTTMIFYNRIGKAGSSTLNQLIQSTLHPQAKFISSLLPSDRGSDEYMTQQGELELIQKLLGNRQLQSNSEHRYIVLAYHTFYLNFTRYGRVSPHYINLVRDPGTRYASQYAFWKTLPDIGPLTREHGGTLSKCLQQHGIGCPPLNYQTSYLCGHEAACRDPPDDASFLQAVRHAVHTYALIGTLERFDEFKRVFVRLFPEWIAENKLPQWRDATRQIVNANHQHKKTYSEKELDEIRAANMYDVLLYEVIEKVFDQRLAACVT